MRLTRHAKNRLRRIRKAHAEVTAGAILRALLAGGLRTSDETGRIRVRVFVGATQLVVVIDPEEQVVVTIWSKER